MRFRFIGRVAASLLLLCSIQQWGQAKVIKPLPKAPNNLKVRVNIVGEAITVTNLNHFAWKHTRFFIDSTGSPENFKSSLATVPPGKSVCLSVRNFHRDPESGSPDFNPDNGNKVLDFLIICDTPKGRHKGYWYGTPLL